MQPNPTCDKLKTETVFTEYTPDSEAGIAWLWINRLAVQTERSKTAIGIPNHTTSFSVCCLLPNQNCIMVISCRLSARCHKLKFRQGPHKKSAVRSINLRELSQVVRKLAAVLARVHVTCKFHIRDLMSSPSKLATLVANCKPVDDYHSDCGRDNER